MSHECEPQLLGVAQSIQQHTADLVKSLQERGISEPSLDVGARSGLWEQVPKPVASAKAEIIGLSKQLCKLLQGPNGFLHDIVSPNWDLGALYAVLEFNILDMIPLDGQVSVSDLSRQSSVPEDKLLRILRLTCCEGILTESPENIFRHTAISEALMTDKNFRAFIGFQLFETRVASAHLADSLKQENNDFTTGQSAFKYAWGSSMYDWHQAHPERGSRFRLAMESVGQSLDPGNALFCNWFQSQTKQQRSLVVAFGSDNTSFTKYLAEQFSNLSFSIQDSSDAKLIRGREQISLEMQHRIKFQVTDWFNPRPEKEAGTVLAYVLRNFLWNWSDMDAVACIKSFLPIMKKSPETVLLLNDGISPEYGELESNEEKPYRRRDFTMMTMHNVRQRTRGQWSELIKKVDPGLKASLSTAFSPHTYRGLWVIRWEEGTLGNAHA